MEFLETFLEEILKFIFSYSIFVIVYKFWMWM
jgi:hypothetical protein